jgi:protein-S-isoprenylcysteine O-methyltransferase Ste14
MRMERWNVVFLIGFIVYLTIRGVFKQRTKGNEKVVSRVDTRERILLVLVIATSFFAPMLYLFTPWLSFADYRLPDWAPWCGLVIMTVAIWLFWRSHADLGQNWSVTLEVRKGHEVVRRGVYRFIRHPMYASIWLWGVAQGLLLQNWLAGWSAFVTFGIMYFLRVDREEQMMCEFFGDQYREYMEKTGRLFPRLRPRQQATGQ